MAGDILLKLVLRAGVDNIPARIIAYYGVIELCFELIANK